MPLIKSIAKRTWRAIKAFPKEVWRWYRIFFSWCKENPQLILPLAAAVITLANTHILLGPVLNRSGDNIYHILNQYSIAHGIRAGDNPLGPLGMEFGQPVLRFYQALFYLLHVSISLVFRVHLMFLHNLTIVVCFAASPFGYYYFMRKLGVNKWGSGIASMVTMTSIAAFGNSFEAYHQAGIVTQSMGGLFFPWFMGNFIGLLRRENRASTTAFLFAMAFLSHAIMSVFAVFAGALYFLVTRTGFRRSWKKLALFCIFGSTLVAFWVLPFLHHTNVMRPVPDSIIRGQGVHWFTSVSKDELNVVLTTGRLLDDASATTKKLKTPEDQLMDKISIIHTLRTRPPIVSLLVALGSFIALFGVRRDSRRFLLAGFAFSLMLFAGPDDYPWLIHLPFMKQIQTFRCTYLIEFFAFGLVGVGVETVLRKFWRFLKRRQRFVRLPLYATWTAVALSGFIWCGNEIFVLGQTHLKIRNPKRLDAMVDGVSTLPYRARPFRIAPKFSGRVKIFHAWLARFGYQPYCTHWKGTGPTAAYHMCMSLGTPVHNGDLHALAGIRYYTGEKNEIKAVFEGKDKDGDPVMERLPNGRDRTKKNNDWHYLLDTGRDHFLRPYVGQPVPVVCSHSQWIWLNKSWISKFRHKLQNEHTPFPMRVPQGELASSGLLEHSEAVLYLEQMEESDVTALEQFKADGGILITPSRSESIESVTLNNENETKSKSIWAALPDSLQPSTRAQHKTPREETDPALEFADIKHVNYGSYSVQNHIFDVELLKPMVTILPMQAAPGWNATLDGEPLPTFSSGGDMVGVYLPEGAHRLAFQWRMPGWHRACVYISILSMLSILGIWIYAIIRRIRRRTPAAFL